MIFGFLARHDNSMFCKGNLIASLSKFRQFLNTNGATKFLAGLQVMLLVMLSTTSLPVQTRIGVHCPTAKVQTIAVKVTSTSCCKPGLVSRAPKLGEKEFKQCFCAEKKSGKNNLEKLASSTDSREIVLLPLSPDQTGFEVPNFPRTAFKEFSVSLVNHPNTPLVPPPTFI